MIEFFRRYLPPHDSCLDEECQSEAERRNDMARQQAEESIRRLDDATRETRLRYYPIADMIRRAESAPR